MDFSPSTTITQLRMPETNHIGQKLIVRSKYTQIGDNSKAYLYRRNNDLPKTEVVQPRISENTSDVLNVQGDIVQVIPPRNSPLAIEVLSNNDNKSTVQVGDNTKLHLLREESLGRHNNRSHCRKNVCREKNKRPSSANTKTEYKKRASEIKDNFSLPPSDASKVLYNRFSEEVWAILHPLRDDGQWDLFYNQLNDLRSQHQGEPEWEILLLLEEAQQTCYKSSRCDIGQAEDILCEILRSIKRRLINFDPTIVLLCEARAYCCLASVYRHSKRNFFGKTSKCLEEAQIRLKGTPFLYDIATVYYEKASFLLEYANNADNEESIQIYLDKCDQICNEIKKDKKCDFLKKDRFSKLKKAILLFNCSTSVDRNKKINDEKLQEAKNCLNNYEMESKNYKMLIGERLLFLQVKFDIAHRCGYYDEAKEIIDEVIELASCHGYDMKSALQRREDIVKNMFQNSPAFVPTHAMKTVEEKAFKQCCSGEADVSTNSEDSE